MSALLKAMTVLLLASMKTGTSSSTPIYPPDNCTDPERMQVPFDCYVFNHHVLGPYLHPLPELKWTLLSLSSLWLHSHWPSIQLISFKNGCIFFLLWLCLLQETPSPSNLKPRVTFCPRQKSDHPFKIRTGTRSKPWRWKEGLSLLSILEEGSEINVEVKKSRW